MELNADTVEDVATGSSRLKRIVLILIGLVSIMAAVSAIQLTVVSQRADRAEMHASRLVSEEHAQYATSRSLESLSLRIQAENRRLLDDVAVRRRGTPSDRWIAAAEWRAYQRLMPIVEELADLPSDPALPPFLQNFVSFDSDEQTAALASVGDAMAQADSYSNSERVAAESLFALAIGVALLAFSGIVAHRGAALLTLGVASAALLMCGLLVASNML